MGAYLIPSIVRKRCRGFLDNPGSDGITPVITDQEIAAYIAQAQERVNGVMQSALYSPPFDQPTVANVPLQIIAIVRDLAAYDCMLEVMIRVASTEENKSAKILRDVALDLMKRLMSGPERLMDGVTGLPLPRQSRIQGQQDPLDIRNLIPESFNRTTYDPTDPNSNQPLNTAGQIDTDLLTP